MKGIKITLNVDSLLTNMIAIAIMALYLTIVWGLFNVIFYRDYCY